MSHAIDVTDATFKDVVLSADKPVLVDFWAEWCGPCKKLGPIVEEIAAEMKDQVTVAKVDVDANRQLAAMFQIMSIPTVMIFKDGERVAELTGVKPKSLLEKKLQRFL